MEWGREHRVAWVPEPPAPPQPGTAGTPAPPEAVRRDGETSRREALPPAAAQPPARSDRERGSAQLASAPPTPAAEVAAAVSPVAQPRPAPIAVPPPLPKDPRHGALAWQERRPTISLEADHARRLAPEHAPTERVASRQPQPLRQASAPVAAPFRASLASRDVPAAPRPADTPQTPPRQRERVAEKAPASPRVQVTIGRIEIRAANAPAQPRTLPRPPSMSLDDYLAKRGQG